MIQIRRASAGRVDVLAVFLIALHVACFTVHTDRSARAFDACVVNAPAGLTAPRFFLDNDSYAWLGHARELTTSGDWCIRHTFMDNAPFGRDLHWSHPLLWGLRGLATLFMRWNDWPLARALDLAGVWIMPMFQFLILSLVFCLFRRKLGWGTAGLFILLCLALEPLASIFHPLALDHHGLQAFTAFLSFCCLYFGGMGWVRPVAAGSDAWRMLGTFDDAPKLYYFTGIPSVASFYWENLEGWQAEARFYGDGETARAIALKRGLTHATALSAPHQHCILTFSALLAPALQIQPTLAARMTSPGAIPPLPAWMRKDLPLSDMLSDRILIRSGKDYLHMQNSTVVYSLEPSSRSN